MSYLDRLKALDSTNAPLGALTEPTKGPSVSSVGSAGGPFPQDATLPADLRALIERVAAHYRTPPDELRVMLDIARANVASARESFTATARRDGLE